MSNVTLALTARRKQAYKAERMRQIRAEGQIRAVGCPKCGAKVGESCHSDPGWWPTDFHAARKEVAAG